MLRPGRELPDPHTHLRLCFQRRTDELRFVDPRRFGGLWLTVDDEGPGADAWIGQRPAALGTDALAITPRAFQWMLKRSRQIKGLLLDQTIIAGLGNIYCDEILHGAGIHPLTPSSQLDTAQVRRLHQQMRKVLRAAIRDGGSTVRTYRTATNTAGRYQKRHRVYQRADQPCRTCGTPIDHLTVAGRSTFFCPVCQRLTGTIAEHFNHS